MTIRVVVAGGGTGGHLFPGLAVVEEMRRQGLEPEVTFIGTERGIEARVLPKQGENVRFIDVRPLKGRGPRELLRNLSALPASGAKAAQLLRELRPDLVIGVGGYAAGPVLAAALALRIPTAIMEQNATPGLTNRLLVRHVGRAYASFEGTFAADVQDAARIVVSGNPIRRALVDVAHARDLDPDAQFAHAGGVRQLLVLGGSQGARALNQSLPARIGEMVSELGDDARRAMRVVHQVGRGDVEAVRQAYADSGIDAEVTDFIEDMSETYRRSELVVARAGASTVAELCALGCASVLVPFPLAADDHQTKNALALARAGAAIHLAESELVRSAKDSETSEASQMLVALWRDDARRRSMARAARGFGKPDAAATIVDDLVAWLGWRSDGASRRDVDTQVNAMQTNADSGEGDASARSYADGSDGISNPRSSASARLRGAENNVFGRTRPYIPSSGGALVRRVERLADEPVVPFVHYD